MTHFHCISVKSAPNWPDLFPTCSQKYSRFFHPFRIFLVCLKQTPCHLTCQNIAFSISRPFPLRTTRSGYVRNQKINLEFYRIFPDFISQQGKPCSFSSSFGLFIVLCFDSFVSLNNSSVFLAFSSSITVSYIASKALLDPVVT